MCRTAGDEMPWERKVLFYGHREKFIHTVGVVATAEWRSLGDHGYTGVFTGSVVHSYWSRFNEARLSFVERVALPVSLVASKAPY